MDEMVKKALAKWPGVAHCYGWLGLDARGNWYLRDERAQGAGVFASNIASKGSRLEHAGLIGFIERNYEHDELGQWFFQNGPQRVYVELQACPWIWRVGSDGAVFTHTGVPAFMHQIFCDQEGLVYLNTSLGFGLVHTQDVLSISEVLERNSLSVQQVCAQGLPERFGYVMSPMSLHEAQKSA